MANEIERKFLVDLANWVDQGKRRLFKQGYLSVSETNTLRIRITEDQAFLTIKGKRQGLSRPEFEYAIPLQEAEDLMLICTAPPIEKYRYNIEYSGKEWEVDVFAGENEGLVIAEVELSSEDEEIELPPWVGEEVSHDRRYDNQNLISNPFRKWGAKK